MTLPIKIKSLPNFQFSKVTYIRTPMGTKIKVEASSPHNMRKIVRITRYVCYL